MIPRDLPLNNDRSLAVPSRSVHSSATRCPAMGLPSRCTWVSPIQDMDYETTFLDTDYGYLKQCRGTSSSTGRMSAGLRR